MNRESCALTITLWTDALASQSGGLPDASLGEGLSKNCGTNWVAGVFRMGQRTLRTTVH